MRPIGLIIPSNSLAPVKGAFMPLDPSLTALYGLNGAGKSYVLDALRSCLSGIGTRRGVGGIRLLAATPPKDFSYLMRRAWGQFFSEDVPDAGSMKYRRDAFVEYSLEQHWERFYETADFELREELATEFCEADTWLFEPTGVSEPSWDISPAVIGQHGSASQKFLDWLVAADDFDIDAMSPIYSAWGDTTEGSDGRPLEAPIVLDAHVARRNISNGRFFPPFIDDSAESLDSLTAYAIADYLQRRDDDVWLESSADEPPYPGLAVLAETVTSLGREVESAANDIYEQLLHDAPALTLATGESYDWLRGASIRWKAQRLESDEPRPIEHLSQAERRWATIAIQLAVSPVDRPLLLLDEPEAALHRSAESQLVAGLTKLTSSGEVSVVTATHSPLLLDSRAGEVYYVRRRGAGTEGALVHLSEVDFTSLGDLGLLPSDLLRRTRGFILVEGEHDLVILEGAFGGDLKQLGVEILPLRGAAKLKDVVDSRFLFEFTDAVLFPLLDDVQLETVVTAWEEARRRAKIDETSAAVDSLLHALKGVPGTGKGYYQTFLTRALQRGLDSRVIPLGVSLADILLYLPVSRLIADASTWEDVRAEYAASTQEDEINETKFKAWLKQRKHVDLSTEHLAHIATTSPAHPELKALLAGVAEALDRKLT